MSESCPASRLQRGDFIYCLVAWGQQLLRQLYKPFVAFEQDASVWGLDRFASGQILLTMVILYYKERDG